MRSCLVVALLFTACKKESAVTPPSPKPPASTEAQDALWKLAPGGATVGVVVSPGTD